MKNLSIWAKNNRVKALITTIILHVILGYYYFYAGALLFTEKIILPSIMLYISGVLILVAYTFYPIKYVKKGIFKSTFLREKKWQLVGMISTAIFMIFIGNQSTRLAFSPQNSLQEYSVQQVALDIKKEAKEKKFKKIKNWKLIRKAKRQLRKRVKSNVRELKKIERGMTDFGKFLAIFFSVLVAIGLGILVLGVSCNLSCSGNEAFAAVVLIGGFILVIAGLIAVIRKIVLTKSREAVRIENKENLG